MIIGHGIDIVELTRFNLMADLRLRRLANRICTDFELAACEVALGQLLPYCTVCHPRRLLQQQTL
jgi:phosphopantetheinyl transferase (holo-ACP synthase)